MQGVARLPLRFGDLEVWHAVLMAKIESEGLIGVDKDKVLMVRNTSLPFREERGKNIACQITAATTVIVPALSEVVLEGRVLIGLICLVTLCWSLFCPFRDPQGYC